MAKKDVEKDKLKISVAPPPELLWQESQLLAVLLSCTQVPPTKVAVV